MELDAFEFEAAMADGHDDAVGSFRGDGEIARKRSALNDQGVIAGGGEGIGKFAEDALAVVLNGTGFAVEEARSANDASTERGADGLMTKADAEDGIFRARVSG